MQRVTVTVDDELVSEIDHFMKARGYQNRSEALRDLARAALQRRMKKPDKAVIASLHWLCV